RTLRRTPFVNLLESFENQLRQLAVSVYRGASRSGNNQVSIRSSSQNNEPPHPRCSHNTYPLDMATKPPKCRIAIQTKRRKGALQQFSDMSQCSYKSKRVVMPRQYG